MFGSRLDLDDGVLPTVGVELVAVGLPVVLELAAVDEVAEAVGAARFKIEGDGEVAVREWSSATSAV